MAYRITRNRRAYHRHVRIHLEALEEIEGALKGVTTRAEGRRSATDEFAARTLRELGTMERRAEVPEFAMSVKDPDITVDFTPTERVKVTIGDISNVAALTTFERVNSVLRQNRLRLAPRIMRSGFVAGATSVLAITSAVVAVGWFLNGRVLDGAIAGSTAIGMGAGAEWVRRARHTEYRVFLVRRSEVKGFWRTSENGPLIGLFGALLAAVVGVLLARLAT